MEIKGLKKNEQVKDKMKRQSWNIENSPPSKITTEELAQGSLKRVHSSEIEFFSSNSLKQTIFHLSKMSLSPSPIRLNRRHGA